MATAAEIVEDMFDKAKEIATESKDRYREATQTIRSEVDSLKSRVPPERRVVQPNILKRTLDNVRQPGNPALEGMSFDEYAQRLEQLQDMITQRVLDMFDRFLPNGALLDEGELKELLMGELGGTGIAPTVDDAIWARDRNRIMADGQRAQQELMAAFAARRFPVPPGALVNAIHLAQQNMQDKIAEASAAIVAKRTDQEIEHRRFVFEKLVQLRIAIIDAAGNLMRTVVGLVTQGTQDLLSVEKYNADVHNLRKEYLAAVNEQHAQTGWRYEQASADSKFDKKQRDYNNDVNAVDKRIAAFTDEAKALATQAAAIMNALHGSAGISGSAGMSVNYSYANDTTDTVPPVTAV